MTPVVAERNLKQALSSRSLRCSPIAWIYFDSSVGTIPLALKDSLFGGLEAKVQAVIVASVYDRDVETVAANSLRRAYDTTISRSTAEWAR